MPRSTQKQSTQQQSRQKQSTQKQYTQKQFEQDLTELEVLIKKNSLKGGVKKCKYNGYNDDDCDDDGENEDEAEERAKVCEEYEECDKKDDKNRCKIKCEEKYGIYRGGKKEQYGGDEDEDEDEEHNIWEGGKKEYTGLYRHFKMVEADGKQVKSDARADIKENQTPLNAAKKLLTSMVKKEKLSDNAKTKLKVIFYIQETNRDSKSKIYGPYIGTYYKYTASEAAKAKAAKGSVSFKFKPIVKLYKGNKKEQKGGKYM